MGKNAKETPEVSLGFQQTLPKLMNLVESRAVGAENAVRMVHSGIG